ncbi:MAG: hypothetical protein K8L91_31795 [Anaerolineae bacterium]|nr:hypothetical protein [Anaerolineae bacterium]
MRFTIKFLLLVQITLAALVVLGPAKPALACSGTPATIDEILERTQYVVKATIIEVDDLNQNYVLEAQSYIAGGSGPRYILLTLNPPIILEGVMQGFHGGGDCNGLLGGLPIGETAYLFVYRNSDGSYETASGPLFEQVFYPYQGQWRPEPQYEIYMTEEAAYSRQGDLLSESEFLDLIATKTHDSPMPPRMDTPYPLKSPLLINTSNATFMLPLDGQSLFKITQNSLQFAHGTTHAKYGCIEIGCTAISPNELHSAALTNLNEVIIYGTGDTIVGQSFLFSSTSDTIAVWNGNTLRIYLLRLPGDAPHEYRVTLLNETILRTSVRLTSQVITNSAVWSKNGRFLAYSDTEGLWLWDIFSSNILPRLLVHATDQDEIPLAGYFSPLDRYIAVSVGSNHFTLDTLSGEKFPYGVVSPDDRYLIPFDPLNEQNSIQICYLTPYSCLSPRLQDSYIKQIIWRNEDAVIITACSNVSKLEGCRIYQLPTYLSYDGYTQWFFQQEGIIFAYDSITETLAVLSSKGTVSIDGSIHDLRPVLSGQEVTSMVWMQPLFYYID